MTNLIINNLILVILLPLWIFLIIMLGRFFSVYVNKKIIYTLSLLSSLYGSIVTYYSLYHLSSAIEWEFPFIQIKSFILSAGLRIDKLSLILSLILFGISFCVQFFSISYMKDERKSYRFYALLNLFNFAMSLMLFSPNLFQMYFFWELIGVISYLLIGFKYSNLENSTAAKRVFIINRIGDTALLGAIILTSYYMHSYSTNKLFVTLNFDDLNAISTMLMAYSPEWIFYSISALFIIGAAVKSAQFPFHIWLQDAMKANNPVSALLHSATIVVSGIYLLIRLMPFLVLYQKLLAIILWIGILTSLICSILASIEIHPKKILAYSTSASLGLMFAAVGLENIKACIVFLCIHALIKSSLFLLVPKDNKNISNINFCLFFILSVSLAFFSKSVLPVDNLIIYGLITFLTAYYIFRLLFTFKRQKLKPDLIEITPVCILIVCNLALYIYSDPKITIFAIFALLGACLCKIIPNINKSPSIMESLCYNIIPSIYNKFCILMKSFENNIFSNYKPIITVSKLTVSVNSWIETNIMNKSVNLIANFARWISKEGMILQNRNIQTYNAYAFILVTIVIALVIIGYTYLLPIGS